MVILRGLILVAIYGISCVYGLRLRQLVTDRQDAYGKINPQSQPKKDYKPLFTKNFEQKLNHFDKDDKRKWTQNYYHEDKYYKNGGPAYLWIEGTGFFHSYRLKTGYWVSHAKKNKAALFSIDHRFHYFSQPLQNTSTANLAYLTVPQALADYAEFIKGMNELYKFPKKTKWIIFGTSYGGNLAAWMRTKYPDLVHGAVASSAPVLAKMEIPEYLDNVAKSIESFNKKCSEDIALANEKLDELAKTKNGKKEINDTFNLCEPLDDNKLSISVFVDGITSYLSDDIQYDLNNNKLRKICDKMLENADTKTPIQRYAKLMDNYLQQRNKKCHDSNFDAEIDSLQKDDMYSSLLSRRTWLYQMCTEFGWFMVTGKKFKTFSKNLNQELYLQMCTTVFKPSFNNKFISQAVEKTNKSFGGLKLNTERTLFVHGSNDPWLDLGITSTKDNKNVEVIMIKGGSHSSETIHYNTKQKNKKIEKAVKKIMATLDSWLKK